MRQELPVIDIHKAWLGVGAAARRGTCQADEQLKTGWQMKKGFFFRPIYLSSTYFSPSNISVVDSRNIGRGVFSFEGLRGRLRDRLHVRRSQH